MAERWRDEDRYERAGNYEGEFERSPQRDFDHGRSFGERGYRDYGRGWRRDYGGEEGRYGGFQGRGIGTYNPRSDYDRGPFPYDAEYGAGPRYGGGYAGPYGFGRDYERDYARTPAAVTNFRGRGPKGYTRQDDRIREDVCDRLTDDPAIDASDIEVKVANGEVILTGTVGNRGEKRQAEDNAEFVTGVRNVQNLLRVEERAGAPGMATEIRGSERTGEPAARGGATAAQPAGTRTPETV